MSIKLKQKDIAAYRADQIRFQQGICPLCLTELLPEEACLDHDHDTGYVRFALHRSCNSAEGRIVSWAKRSRASDPYFFLKNLYDLHRKDYSNNPIHPAHLTPTEKKIKQLKKHKKKLKTQKGKDRVQGVIDKLEALE